MFKKQTYPWLDATWKSLSAYLEQGRLPNALMVTGGAGFGLFELVENFAQSTFCLKKEPDSVGCGHCSACVLFAAGNYPDYKLLQPEEGESSIKIEATRALIKTLCLSNQFEQQRIAVIVPADSMARGAANSLLKTLEEPSENTSIILISYQPAKLPATIRSRCQQLTLKHIDNDAMIAWLTKQGCDQPQQALSLANGEPLSALALWQEGALEVRNELFSCFERLIQGHLSPIEFAEIYLKKKEYPVLMWLMTWLSDCVKVANQADEALLLNRDLYMRLNVLLERLHLKRLHGLLAMLAKMRELEISSVNKQLMYENFAISCLSTTHK